MTKIEGKRWGIYSYGKLPSYIPSKYLRQLFGKKATLLVRCGSFIYDVSDYPEIYYQAR